MTPDAELLRRYAAQGDEAAFAEVVRRQVNLVYAVALRVTNGNAALAEDVAQSVFTDLARKAGPLSRHEALAGWLHTSARFAALKVLRGEQRRHHREQEAAMQNSINAPEPDWAQLQPVLDEAVSRLREKDRAAVVLRFFQGLSHREVGEALGLNENTARKRVNHALEKLRGHFARAGISVSSALLDSALTAHSAQTAPAGLADKITKPSLVGAAGSGTVASALLGIFLMSTKSKALLAIAAVMALIAFIGLDPRWRTQPAALPEKIAAVPTKPSTPAVAQPAMPTTLLTAALPASDTMKSPQASSQTTPSTPSADPRTEQAKSELQPIIADIIQNLTADPTNALTSHMPGQMGALKSTVDAGLANLPPNEAAALRQKMADNNAALARSSGVRIRMIQFQAMLEATPTLNVAGDVATYAYSPETLAQISAIRPDISVKNLPHSFQFIKRQGQWYIDPNE